MTAYQSGAMLDSWDEYFKFNIWDDAVKTSGVDPEFYKLSN